MSAVAAATLTRRVTHVMGMPISLAVRARTDDPARARAIDDAWAQAVATLQDVDRVFSTYRADSVVSRLNRGELDLADAPPEVAEVLGLAERMRVESHGAFDVRRHDPDHPDGRRVLDTDGVVKGWAVERAARVLDVLPDTDFCLAAGGDMVCRVADPRGAAWRVGVEDPADPSRLIARIPVRNGGVATSAFTHRGAHIVDARTGRVPTGVRSVTVVAASLTDADLDATAAFALGAGALPWLRGRPHRAGLVVHADGSAAVFGAP